VNRIRINLNTCEIEVESWDSSLADVFNTADEIARHLGRTTGLTGEELSDKIRRVGIG
jgi:hypothetical protein